MSQPAPSCRCCPPGIGRPAGRRALLAGLACIGLSATSVVTSLATSRAARASASGLPPTSLNPDQALEALLAGNARFLAGAVPASAPNAARRALLASGQAPFAAILGCADSRAAPELLFHTGLGELFVVRNAGNIADTGAIGSLEYAVANLGVPLIMVLGHEHCGAAGAAVTMARDEVNLPSQLRDMLLPILPSALAAVRAGGDATDGTVRRNIARNAERLVSSSPVIGAAVAAGRAKVVGAYYTLSSEAVSLLT